MPRRKKPITRQLHHWSKRFSSIADAKAQILKEFSDEFPNNANIDIGYHDGRQSSKIWLVSEEDLAQMYKNCKHGNEISLWVDFMPEEDSEEEEHDKKKPKSQGCSKRSDVEDEVEMVYNKLAAKHTDSGVYSAPQLRLWARMIQSGTHDDYDDPPRVPQITGLSPKYTKKETLTDAITGAAVAIAKVFSPKPKTPECPIPKVKSVGISPGKSAELRMQNLQQLRFLQQLMEENVLSQSEFIEQKTMILEALRQLK